MRWQPVKPRTRIRVFEGGAGVWDEQEHKLDFLGPIETVDFKVTGPDTSGINRIYRDCCADRRKIADFNEKQAEHRISAWICRHACSRCSTQRPVIGFEREAATGKASEPRVEFLK